MVVWEITLATAYILGLKRTYKLALKIQRRLITSKHPKIRAFVHGRTRAAFNVALRVHQNIQQRDIAVGRSVGNWILRWLDRMKPSAQIRASSSKSSQRASTINTNITKQVPNSSHPKSLGGFQNSKARSDRHMFSSPAHVWPKPFRTIAMMMRPERPTGTFFQHRNLCISGAEFPRISYGINRSEGVIRRDVMQWMMQK